MSTLAAIVSLALIVAAIAAGYYAIGRFVVDTQHNNTELKTGARGVLSVMARGFNSLAVAPRV
ncbi:hypothetical protein [Brevibacterium litoralis]|uniref:hypothetical protein n=1 Tax=Brevibacterium litoralis TaxID=3138935 RepID=UPI0032EF5956